MKGYLPETCLCRVCQSQLGWDEIPGCGPDCKAVEPESAPEPELSAPAYVASTGTLSAPEALAAVARRLKAGAPGAAESTEAAEPTGAAEEDTGNEDANGAEEDPPIRGRETEER